MSDNLSFGILAIVKSISLFLTNLVDNRTFIGFASGIFISVIVTGFILTENPEHLPVILRYSSADSFEKLVPRDESGTYVKSFSSFSKVHSQVRTLFLLALISFFIMVTTIVIKTK